MLLLYGSYDKTDVFVVMYSVVSPLSFAAARDIHIPELRAFNPKTPIILVGTKIDVRDAMRYTEIPSVWQPVKSVHSLFPRSFRTAIHTLFLIHKFGASPKSRTDSKSAAAGGGGGGGCWLSRLPRDLLIRIIQFMDGREWFTDWNTPPQPESKTGGGSGGGGGGGAGGEKPPSVVIRPSQMRERQLNTDVFEPYRFESSNPLEFDTGQSDKPKPPVSGEVAAYFSPVQPSKDRTSALEPSTNETINQLNREPLASLMLVDQNGRTAGHPHRIKRNPEFGMQLPVPTASAYRLVGTEFDLYRSVYDARFLSAAYQLSYSQCITTAMGEALAQSTGCVAFREVSAVTTYGLDDLFRFVIRTGLKEQQRLESTQTSNCSLQ